ncbi:hypothetical protein [Croceibacterium mercuriale]|uniref:hypothetical protein n=1 Tax=Croceibacterium mercuriale TaxID=1572751 RepID=UPI00068AF704|nr:hypothetical protein [Croceibacterium mercuriale]
MIPGARAGLGGWQTMLADLALILFLVAASALDRPDAAPAPVSVTPPQVGTPAAIWRDKPDAPPLAEWLASEQRDPRLQLTLLAAPVDSGRALALAADLPDARVVIQPRTAEQTTGVIAILAYDRVP